MTQRPTRNQQAAQLLGEMVDAIVSGEFDLLDVLRKGFHACGLAGWSEAQTWFQKELQGHPAGADLPEYRRNLPGQTAWHAASAYDIPAFLANRSVYGEPESPEPVQLDFRGSIVDAIKWSQKGLTARAGEVREREGPKPWREAKKVTYFGRGFQRIVQWVESWTFHFASNAYTTLTYGDVLQDVWEGYRASSEPVLSDLGLDKHLEAIREGMASDNPEQWRAAMFACRNVLVDLAAHLWRDEADTYPPLAEPGHPLRVDESSYINRLAAYLHFKAVTGQSSKYLRSELERINSSLHTLNELDSKGHAPVSRQDARMAAIGTYFLLGEFIQRTDMQPVLDTGLRKPSNKKKRSREADEPTPQ